MLQLVVIGENARLRRTRNVAAFRPCGRSGIDACLQPSFRYNFWQARSEHTGRK